MQIIWCDRICGDKKYIDGYVGEWRLFTIYYDETDHTGQPKDRPWSVNCSLPGVKSRMGNYKTKEAALSDARASLRFWLNKLHSKKRPDRNSYTQFSDVVAQIGGAQYDKTY